MGYADLDSAKVQLELSDDNEGDADSITLLAAIDAEISRTLELKTGRVWGGTATPAAKAIEGARNGYSNVLLLPAPLRSVTGVTIAGYSPETLTQSLAHNDGGHYILWNVTREGDAYALKRIDGRYWPRANGIDRVTVTGVWSDTASGVAVPQEIVDAATFVVVETYRQRKSSPTGEIGPEGFTIRPRNPWRFETVVEAINKYSGAKPAVMF